MKKLNGDVKVIVERIDNLKELVKNEFKENREEHTKIFDVLVKHGAKIMRNDTYLKVGAVILTIIITLIINIMIGG